MAMGRVRQLVFDQLDDPLRVPPLLLQHVRLIAQPLPLPLPTSCAGRGIVAAQAAAAAGEPLLSRRRRGGGLATCGC